ncbi:MAG TPA: hypothetical protein VJ819_14615, partial [Nocardioidaceae bacterium]|nr:hypothetical protein [Nocardioidaceae bacterium]
MRALRRAVAVAGLSALVAGGLVTLAEQPASAAGVDFYVAPASASPAGNDTPTCGPSATPCRTVAYAYARAAESDIINIRPGTYLMNAAAVAGTPVANTNTNRLSLTKSMTIRKDPASVGTVVLDGGPSAVNSPIITLATVGKSLTLIDLTLQDGFGSFGGAITLGNGTGTTVNATDVVYLNHLGIVGGAIDVGNTATYTQTGGSFTGNTAGATTNGGLGGAVFVTGRVGAAGVPGSASFTNVTFTGNRALGGPTANTGNGGALWNAGLLSVSGSTFGTNGALQGTAGTIRGFGGAIFNGALDGDDAPSLTVSSTTINGGLPSGTPAFSTNATHG